MDVDLWEKFFCIYFNLITKLGRLDTRGHPMATLKEMFEVWVQEVLELFNSIME